MTAFLGILQTLDLTGYLFPADEERYPVLVSVDGEGLHLPVFSEAELLYTTLALVEVEFDRVLRILDSRRFLMNVFAHDADIKIIADPSIEESGRLRFLEVITYS